MHIGNVPGITHYGAVVNYMTWLPYNFHFDHILIYHAYMWITVDGVKEDEKLFNVKHIKKMLNIPS